MGSGEEEGEYVVSGLLEEYIALCVYVSTPAACAICTEIQPRGLALQPGIHNVLDQYQLLLPVLDLFLKWFDERGAPHRLCLNDMVIQ